MKVILLKGVQKLGNKYDIVEVSEGYALNSLFPRHLAEHATPGALKRVTLLKAEEDVQKKIREDLLLKNLKSLADVKIVIEGKASEKGHFFAGIHKDEIIKALKEQADVDMDSAHIDLEKPIKDLGEHKIDVKVQDKHATFTVELKALE